MLKVRSNLILKKIFGNLKENKLLQLIKYNKLIQNKLFQLKIIEYIIK